MRAAGILCSRLPYIARYPAAPTLRFDESPVGVMPGYRVGFLDAFVGTLGPLNSSAAWGLAIAPEYAKSLFARGAPGGVVDLLRKAKTLADARFAKYSCVWIVYHP